MGTLTITTTAPQDARLVAAYGSILGLGRSATAAEIKADIIATYKQRLKNFRDGRAAMVAVSAINPPTMS